MTYQNFKFLVTTACSLALDPSDWSHAPPSTHFNPLTFSANKNLKQSSFLANNKLLTPYSTTALTTSRTNPYHSTMAKKAASSPKNPYKNGGKKKGTSNSSSPSKHKREKVEKGGMALQKYGDIVHVLRLREKLRIGFVVRGNDRMKGAYVQHLVNLVRNGDDSVAHLGIDAVLPRRVSDGSNNRMMDGTYPMRQFLQVLNEDDDDSPEAAKKWGEDIAKKMTELGKTSMYPSNCSYGGDLTPADGPAVVDTYLLNSDVVNVASHLYKDAIIDGSFFEPLPADDEDDDDDSEPTPPLSAQFFHNTGDPRSLFMNND